MPEPEEADVTAARLFAGLLRRTHLSKPSDLVDVVVQEARTCLGARQVVLFLVNYEFTALMPVPARLSPHRLAQPLAGSMAGRCFTSTTIVFADALPITGAGTGPDASPDAHLDADSGADSGADAAGPDAGAAAGQQRRRVWVPLLDGTDRLGVLEMTLPAPGGEVAEELVAICERYAHLIAQSIVSKSLYGDVFARVQRTRPMSVGSELMRAMLPPLLFATDGLVVAGMLEPAYDNGGDAFDYALNDDVLHVAVFDGMGHGLAASTVTTVALAAYRHARIEGLELSASYDVIDGAVLGQFGGARHVTAVLAELHLPTGRLSWISAGHPPPLLLRAAKVVKTLQAPAAFPLGWDFGGKAVVAEEVLQPGDAVLLYTDGLIEARRPGRSVDPGGERGGDGGGLRGGELSLLGIEGLSGFLEREAAAGQLPPETLRRMRRALLEHQSGVLQDDASALLVEWRRGNEHRLMPQSVDAQVDEHARRLEHGD